MPERRQIMSLTPDSRQGIFENLFVLEAANNHWGDLERGKKIIQDFGSVVRFNNIKAAIKFQFRDVENFIATLKLFEVVEARVRFLNHGSHCAIGDDHASANGV
jgi:hypothetical protein